MDQIKFIYYTQEYGSRHSIDFYKLDSTIFINNIHLFDTIEYS